MQVTFTTKGGREKLMPRKHADILQKLGKGTYQTKDMQAAPKQPCNAAKAPAPKQPRKTKEPKQ